MELDRFKRHLQNYLAEGLMLVVGSGISCAEGLPGMNDLVASITAAVAAKVSSKLEAEWANIRSNVPGKGLEGALQAAPPTDELAQVISIGIASAIIQREAIVISRVMEGKHVLPLTRLLKLVSFGASGFPILTTNYDRLVELACFSAGLSIDTLFDGDFIGRLDSERWKFAQACALVAGRGANRLRHRSFVRIFKPHGSLDWWQSASGPMRYSGELQEARAIVTPGLSKYRAGYDEPFNTHRNQANEQLASASQLIILGYGFNDDHIEATSLVPTLQSGKETLIVARELSAHAKKIVREMPKVSAVEARTPGGPSGTRVYHRGEIAEVDEDWWDLAGLIGGVFEP